MFIIGGWLGALITDNYHIRSVGGVAVILGVVFILICREKESGW